MKKSVIAFVLLSTFASAINYLTYPVLARLLPASQYVDITVSLSLLTQITTFLSSIIAITIGLSKSEEHGNSSQKIALLQSILFKLFLGLTLAFLAVSPFLMRHIDLPLTFVIPICAMMIISVPIAIISGYLNGKGRMLKLGVLTVISAGLQFGLAASVASITGNGLLAMLSMAGAQLVTIALIYWLFAKEQLPKVSDALLKKVHVPEQGYLKRLVVYTLFSSIAIMSINLVQIADLLIIKSMSLPPNDIKFYTDIYVISRVVFFGGMIFIWPFLSEIDIKKHHLNHKPFLKAIGLFAGISLATIAGLYVLGTQITTLLFGTNFPLHLIQEIGTLSVIYKLLFLVITAIVLYFMVLRSYTAVWISAVTTIFVVATAIVVPHVTSSMYVVLTTLDIGVGIIALASVGLFFKSRGIPTK